MYFRKAGCNRISFEYDHAPSNLFVSSKSPHFYNLPKVQNTQFQSWSPQTRLCFHILCQSHSAAAKKKQAEKRKVKECFRFHTSPIEAGFHIHLHPAFVLSAKVPTSVCDLTEIKRKVFFKKKKRLKKRVTPFFVFCLCSKLRHKAENYRP